MSWRFDVWDNDITNAAHRVEIPEAGGYMYLIRDFNNAFSSVFVPDMTLWANAIGQAMVVAQRQAVPIGLALDIGRVRHAKQPVPGPGS
jgi:hypothetical protein